AVFADAGALFDAGTKARALNTECGPGGDRTVGICLAEDHTIRSSAGVSLMWNSPLGPLRFDLAKAITKEKYDDEQIFRFGASTKF
ncbi:MAG: BamA/TamA family outer membrane protein, partial [Hyphomicrobiaceae bacterium]